jgi:hypothetical protein
MNHSEARLYRRWIVANAWAEAAGLGTTLLVGRAVAPLLDRVSSVAAVLIGAMTAVLLGTLLEGTLLGAVQARLLRQALPNLAVRRWTHATMLGAAIAWSLGMVPSTLAALSTGSEPQTASTEPPVLVQYGLAAALGLITGPILGAAQYRVLRGYVHRPGWWLAAGWALGMVLIFIGMDLVPWKRGGLLVAASVYTACGVAGAGVGMVHGRMLLQLLKWRKDCGAAP